MKDLIYKEVLAKIKKRYDFRFSVKIVDGPGGSSHPNELWLGKDTLVQLKKEEIEALIIHEAFHQIFSELDETKEFEELDRGNRIPYLKKEFMTWNKVKEEFPEYKEYIFDEFICKLLGVTSEERRLLGIS